MKALRALFACVVCMVAFCCVNEAKAQFKTSGFLLGRSAIIPTMRPHSVDSRATLEYRGTIEG